MFKTKYCYSEVIKVEKNFFVILYEFFSTSRFRRPYSYIHYCFGLLFSRIAFELVRFRVFLPLAAKLGSRNFILNYLNSQVSSVCFDIYKPCYEPEVQAALCTLLPKNGFFVDVGSNWGHHSLTAIEKCSASALLVEPNPRIYKEVISIGRHLQLGEKLVVVNCAVGAENGRATLSQLRFESGVASTDSMFLVSTIATGRRWERWFRLITLGLPIKFDVEVRTLDDILSNTSNPDVVKIDVEGNELAALQGLHLTIIKARPSIIFEIHSGGGGLYNQIFDYLGKFGYVVYRPIVDITQGEFSLSRIEDLESNRHYNLVAIHATRKNFEE